MFRVFILLESRDNKDENTRGISIFLNKVVNTIIGDEKQ